MRAAFSLKRVISWSVLIFFFLFLAYPIQCHHTQVALEIILLESIGDF